MLLRRVAGVAAVQLAVMGAGAFGATIRVATYNIEADVTSSQYTSSWSSSAQSKYLEAVLEGIGNETTAYAGQTAHALDLVGLEETYSNAITVQTMVNNLNAHYGAGTYAMSSLQGDTAYGATSGDGPNAVIYNAKTLTLVASLEVPGTPTGANAASGSEVDRGVMRYQFRPAGGTAADDFYVYVSHMKSSASGTSTEDQGDRNTEATAIRNNEATLPASASVIYMGDYNMDGNTEPGYQTMAAITSPTASGSKSQGAAIDPLNPSGASMAWSGNSSTAYKSMITESTQSTFSYRDDLQLTTQNVYNGTSGLAYVSGSEHAFGNDGTVAAGGDYWSGKAPSSGDYSNLRYDLYEASDHLPVVADYTLAVTGTPVPEAGTAALLGLGVLGLLRRRRV